mmetsp:Transcript_2597/g.5053  ORF Transcript_2597/g.5053 Transcript_2597/m.5053 type:complete len:167 (+) Transcript_2597:69-569(+)|eukprot:CAMPEP_0119070452 /NCGR_PEP_ID=MMETSP1178-20130426/38921_1 /TAXON_ID=33656 /ORGANISM="unid sp, Strain CCMP2000" /LENGTH=166 /DNA_ID=CAMNT_0007052293 /DNA_START=69 /DNA_END=569 /DNA_ORIENTATION=+
MTKTFATVAVLFVALELWTCYILWFDQEALTTGPDTLAPANFAGWKLARRQGTKMAPVSRQLHFYALWVGNNKFIFSTLLLVCAFSSDGLTRLLAALFSSLGCVLYFALNMDASMKLMDAEGDVRPGLAEEIASLIGIVLVMWLCALASEMHAMLKRRGAQNAKPV